MYVFEAAGAIAEQSLEDSDQVMAHFHCRTGIRIRIRTQIPVLCRYYGKGIRI